MEDSLQEPILASTLYLTHQAIDPAPKLASGLSVLDEILAGGFVYGHISCISAVEKDSCASELTVQLLIQHLTATNDVSSDAALIDTTLSFDVRSFHQRVLAALIERGEVDAHAQALTVLKRLRIMRTFDFVGLVECVTELSDSLERDTHAQTGKNIASRGTIADSQDESVDALLDRSPTPSSQDISLTYRGRTLLIVDNFTQPVLGQLKTNHIQGHIVLTSLLRTLSHLTTTYGLATILMNKAIADNRQVKEDSTSIFTSCTLRPALGKAFAGAPDLHLLIHDVPENETSARIMYGEQKGSGKCVSVVEILQDRFNGKVGRWVTCESGPDGRLREVT
nr:putative dna repair protein rad51 like 4 [Quercus suber]